MIDRSLYTPDGSNPPFPVPINDLCTVPTPQMAYFLADLLNSDGDILEIGTGSGYQTAILAERARFVVSIDIEHEYGIEARLPSNVALMVHNGYEFDTGEQFDAILVTFGASRVSPVWEKQLKDGGRLVVPIVVGHSSRISIFERVGNNLILIDVAGYASFTPGAEA